MIRETKPYFGKHCGSDITPLRNRHFRFMNRQWIDHLLEYWAALVKCGCGILMHQLHLPPLRAPTLIPAGQHGFVT
ncbi:hypothetical protein CQ10_32720 [Bradyrhizobium valentinum]|nr:hypothetical protein CQ10_32720 [Bradyrhizobium valentinum]